jgi:glycosyltransferase involved in cell wall biosynthesis
MYTALPLRLAFFSPLPPSRSGIADYSRALLPYLAQESEVTLFAENPKVVGGELKSSFEIRPLSDYPDGRWEFDLALYQMGNSSHHEAIYETALRYPGVVVLHDHGLHHFISGRTAGRDNYPAYILEMGYELGLEGVKLAWDIRERRAEHPLFEVPLNKRLVERSLGLIVHSQIVADMLARQTTARPLRIIPALMEKRTGRPRREALKLSPETVIFASLGLVTAEKRLDLALAAFSQLRREIPNSHFLIVGDAHEKVDVPEMIGRLGLEEAVTHLGFVEDLESFVDWIATADIIINLRHPTVGESSATALRAMAAGKPVIVFDLGWYGELPEGAVVKVRPLDSEGLLAAMRQLAQRPELRKQMGETAAAHIEQRHDPANVAQQYLVFAGEVLAGLKRKFEAGHG